MGHPLKNTGSIGESLACTYLKRKGYIIKGVNFQNTKGYKYGEIDIIAQKKNKIVFVEVKTRIAKKGKIILPEENISFSKLRNLEKIASTYIRVHNLWDAQCGFDALSILIDNETKTAKIRHLEDIFL